MEYNFEDSIGRLTMKISGATGKIIDSKFKQNRYALNSKHWTVLSYLNNYTKINQKQLSELTDLNKVMIKRLIDYLEEKKLVKRTQDKKDHRINFVTLTKKGKNTYNKLAVIVSEMLSQSYEGLTVGDIDTTLKVLHKVESNLNEKL